MEKEKALYAQFMASAGVQGLMDDAALETIGELIDLSDILREEEGVRRALNWGDALQERGVSDDVLVLLDYFRANAWAVIAQIRNRDETLAWAWEQPEVAHQILSLRKALSSPAFDGLPSIRRCQILTNLGNLLNSIGRFVEALEYWSRALSICSDFWMAQGNRGYALIHYAKALYDHGHSAALLLSSYNDLTAALSASVKHKELGYIAAAEAFGKHKAHVEAGINVVEAMNSIQLDGFTLGATKDEERYRRWCLSERLFLNPLNDLGPHSIAARDIMTLPDYVTSLREPPSLIGFFNQLKQEFVSARWLYYDGLHSERTHFSDRDVLLFNTLDYPSYGLGTEKIKIAMRMS